MGETLEVTIAQAGVAVTPPGSTFGPRTLSDFEFVSLVSGYIDGECSGSPQQARPGAGMLLRPQMQDRWVFDTERPTLFAFVHFDVVRWGSALPEADQWPLVRQMPRGNIVQPLCWYVARLANARPPDWEHVSSHAVALLVTAFVHGGVDAARPGPVVLPPAVERALQHVRSLLWTGSFESPKLDELASVVSVSPSHLSHLFKTAVGCGPMEALRLMRLEHASRLLTHTNMSIQQVAHATGFANEFHFSRRFKDLFGRPPRDYRQNAAASGTLLPIPSARSRDLLTRLWSAEDPPTWM